MFKLKRSLLIILSTLLLAVICFQAYHKENKTKIKIGSKTFTESVIIGDIISLLCKRDYDKVIYHPQMGGTQVLWKAIVAGEIDVYSEYTGTLLYEIMKDAPFGQSIEDFLDERGIGVSKYLGFQNNCTFGMKTEVAEALGIEKYSDLKNFPDLKYGITDEFEKRQDGLAGLNKVYKLPINHLRILNHEIAYRALSANEIDITDFGTTDPEIRSPEYVELIDDLKMMPSYQAVILYRKELKSTNFIKLLEGQIKTDEITRMSQDVLNKKESEKSAALNFVNEKFNLGIAYSNEGIMNRIFKATKEQLFLVGVSLFFAILLGIPLGVIAQRFSFGQFVLGFVAIIQTIPSLVLLVIFIPIFGIGELSAIIALFLYSLLPIVRGTYTGLSTISREMRNTAIVLGLPYFSRLKRVELPIALQTILNGIKTAAVINVGTATLAALAGAGGYGQPILAGIRLGNSKLILEGAVPAAVLALSIQFLFDILEKKVVSRGLIASNSHQNI